jgi:cysteine desulfurase
MKRIYLDYAATTPLDPRIASAMTPYFIKQFGNPGSLHSFGQDAIAALDRSREAIAKTISANFREIIFTGSATEANNLALQMIDVDEFAKRSVKPKIIVSAIEHESVLETARELGRRGADIVYLPVDESGTIDFSKLKYELDERTILVSVMFANNEIGVIQPIAEIGHIIRQFKKENTPARDRYPLFHTDAVQAFQFLDCDVDALGVDFMTFSSHKIYGPKGVGSLYVKNMESRKAHFKPVLFGGGQEFGLRSGTENVPAIVGFAKAVELAASIRSKESKRIAALREKLWRGIKKQYRGAEINGSTKSKDALPNILNVYFPKKSAQDLLTKFDLSGLAVSSGSACRSRAMESSHVIEALGHPRERAKSSIRFSLGRPTDNAAIQGALKIIASAT